jgi:kumamolisin
VIRDRRLTPLRRTVFAAACILVALSCMPAHDRALTEFAVLRSGGTSFTTAQLADAYGYRPLFNRGIDGTGETIALIEIDSYRQSDITAFDRASNLAAPHITVSRVDGPAPPLQTGAETTLDVEVVHALAPGAAIQIYDIDATQTGTDSWQAMADALNAAASHGAGTIAISLGSCGLDPFAEPTRSALASLEARGVSVFVASGDNGDHPGPAQTCGTDLGVAYPGSDPSVVAVGGTSLHLAADHTIKRETGWKWSGGGRVLGLTRSAWQVVAGLPSDGARWAPDVSFDANASTGVRIYFHSAWHVAGGTSIGAPAWAAAWALVRSDAAAAGVTAGAAAPLLYAVGNSPNGALAFHDITAGSNGAYTAHPGWDAVTGWGSPNVSGLGQAVIDVPSP